MEAGTRWFLKIGQLNDGSIGGLMQDANELIHCTYSLHQGVDDKGQAYTNVRCGDIVATYDGLPTQDMVNWALKSGDYYNGTCILCDMHNVPLHKVQFFQGACVGMSLDYDVDGASSILTQIHIQPEKISIDGDSVDQHWTNMLKLQIFKDKQAMGKQVMNKIVKLAQPIGKISLDLELEDTTYLIDKFSMSFHQPHDHKGQPQEHVHGGIVHFTLPQVADKKFREWMMKDTMKKDGQFNFRQGDQNTPLRVAFTEAYCIGLEAIVADSKNIATDITISANVIQLNEKWIDNNFKL